MDKQIKNILQKDVSRKEFIQYIGTGLLAILGVSSILKALMSSLGQNQPKVGREATPSYGGGAYGGDQKA